jgi:hypothetical protein
VLCNEIRSVFLKLSSAKHHGAADGCQGFRQMKMRNGGRVLLAVQNLYVRVKMKVQL